MSNRNYVCFPCREAKRNGGACPRCGEQMVCIMRWEHVPRRGDDRAWKTLEAAFWKRLRRDEPTTHTTNVFNLSFIKGKLDRIRCRLTRGR